MDYKPILIPAVVFLIGVVMLFAGGARGAQLGGKILMVILGAIALFLIFGYIVGRAV
ncbi:MAG TPA: hypothetical protein VHL09_14520 [Dehalococcoidia bacterium]|nr:hypothetical protein [Dehalococcoidia bacterium]